MSGFPARTRRSPGDPGDELVMLVDAVEDYAIFLLSPKGVIRSWNRGAERIMGYEAEEAMGRHFSIFYPAADLEARKPDRELETAAADGRIEDEGWRIRKSGERFWADTIITALYDENGGVCGFAKVTRDLTKRRNSEENLRRSEELFRLLLESVQEYAIFMLDPEGHVISWNGGAHRIKGYEPEEIIGKHFSVFYTREDRENGKPERILATAREKGSVEDEGWRVRKDGSRFWANVTITAVHDENGVLRGFAKVTRDVTERKNAEETRRALLEQREARLLAEDDRRRAEASYRVSQEANRAKDEFLMTLSHELRTPMTAILGWARLLPTLAHDDPSFKDAVAAITRGAQLQARLIDDVLDVSRIVSGKLRLVRETIDLVRVLNSALETVRPSAEARHITITTSFEPGLGAIVADGTRVQQVVWNLLSNAVKFTPKRGLIRLIAKRTGSNVQITVEDNGEGIDRSFLPHIFEPFLQAENPKTRVHGGLGLGLSIVRYIVEAHGGNVTAESRGRGTGATFTVTLPVDSVAPAPREVHSSDAELEERRMDPQKLAGADIFVVDDNGEGREMVVAVLKQAGARPTPFECAEDALEALEKHHPHLLLTDIAMPDMDGYTFVREIRKHPEYAGLKIVALTAFAATTTADRADFDDFLTKPIDPFILVDAIAALLHRS